MTRKRSNLVMWSIVILGLAGIWAVGLGGCCLRGSAAPTSPGQVNAIGGFPMESPPDYVAGCSRGHAAMVEGLMMVSYVCRAKFTDVINECVILLCSGNEPGDSLTICDAMCETKEPPVDA